MEKQQDLDESSPIEKKRKKEPSNAEALKPTRKASPPKTSLPASTSRVLKCDQCDWTTKLERGHLRRHIAIAHHGKRFACDQCPKSYTSSSNVQKHIDSVHKNIKRRCAECPNKTFATFDGLRRHRMSVHQSGKGGDIWNEDRANVKESKEKEELEIVKLDLSIQATHAASPDGKEGHNAPKKDPCVECGKSFSNTDSLKRHMGAQHSDIRWPCKECPDTVYKYKTDLAKHIKKMHPNARITDSSKKPEIKMSSPQDTRSYWTCLKCPGKKFSLQGSLRRHAEMEHPEEKEPEEAASKSHQCTLCFEKLPSLEDLISHVEEEHLGD